MKSQFDRLMEKIEASPTGCWLWTGAKTKWGYANFMFAKSKGQGQWIAAHRLTYLIFIGEIPAGLTLDHLCEVRACVNPLHLDPVTQLVNNRRASKGNAAKTHCKRGHDLTAYAYHRPDAPHTRDCLICRRERSRRSSAKMKAIRKGVPA